MVEGDSFSAIIESAWTMSRRNNIVVPGGKMGLAMQIIIARRIHELLECSRGRVG